MRTKLLFSFILMFGLYNLSIGQNCISNITIEQDDCTPFGDYTAFVSFEHSPNVDSVTLLFDGQFFGNHPAAFQPIVLADLPFNPNGNNNHLIELVSTQSAACSDSASFEAICNFDIDDCLSEIFFVDAFCINSTLQFEINYTFLNPGSEGHVYVNDEFIANATVGENQSLSFSVDNINPQSVYEVVVRDAEFPSCGDTLFTQVAPCTVDCTAPFDIATSCNANGTYDISLFHQDDVMTKVYVNDEFISRVIPGSTSPFLIEGVQLDDNQVSHTITTCLVSSPSCCRTLTFELPACETCNTNLTLNEVFCEGFAPAFDISYEYENPVGGAQLFVNGSFIQDVEEGQNSLLLNPQITNDQGTYIIVLQDSLAQTCGDTLIINDFFCDACIVETSNVVTECLSGTDNYLVELDIFNSGNTSVSEFFIIHLTGETFGPFSNIGANGAVQASFEVPTNLQGQFQVFDADGICSVFFNTEVDCNPNSDCSITNVLLDHECINESIFEVFIQFDHSELEGDTVEITNLNGQSLGFFNANQQPITIPINTNTQGSQAFGITITNPLETNCIAESNIIGINCVELDSCLVEFIEVISTSCNPDGTYNLTANYNINIASASEINVNVNGINYDVIPNPNLVFTIEGITARPNSDFDIIAICSQEFPDCCNEIEYQQPSCMGNTDCEIGFIEHEVVCLDSTDAFMVQLFFNTNNSSGEVTVSTSSGEFLGQFGATQTPIVLGPFTAADLNDDGIGFVVCDAQIDGCCADVLVNNIPCMLEIDECSVEFIEVISRDCNSDGTYNLTVTYEIINSNNDFINVSVNGGQLLSFDNTGTLVVNNITPSPNSDFDIIEICLNDNADCCLVNEYQQPFCMNMEECEIGFIEHEVVCLDSTDAFMVQLFFNTNNSSGEFTVSTFTGELLGQFDTTQTPIVLGPFTADDLNDDGIGFVVCDTQIDGCCSEAFVNNIPCLQETDECAIEFIEIISTECNADSTYNLTVEYGVLNGNSDIINISVNGGPMQQFTNSGFMILTNLTPRANSDSDIIQICVSDNLNCCQVAEYIQPVCTNGPQECEIEIGDVGFFCENEQIFFELDVQNNTMNDFMVFVNGEQLGTGNPSDNGTQVGPFEQNDDGFYALVVIDADNPTCSAEFELLQAFCIDTCFIGDLLVDIECLDDSTFTAIISFPYDADHQDGVTIRGNGTDYGTFDGFAQPILIEGLEASANDEWEFIVLDNQDDACQAVAEIGAIDCSNDEIECVIENIEVFNLECIGDNEYALSLSFETGTSANTPFSFFINGVAMSAATTSSLPINLFGIVPSDSSTVDVITICLDDFDGQCCVDFSYSQPSCLFSSVDATLINGVSMSPNPTSNTLYINDIPNDIVGLNVIDNLGRVVEQITSQQEIKLDVSQYQNGIYTVQFFTQDNRVMSRRFVKM